MAIFHMSLERLMHLSDAIKMTVNRWLSLMTVKEAVTHFNVIETFKNYTLVECELETGRTHQIRVHMKYIGYPLVGDPKYGPKKTLEIGGQALHAGLIGFEHPKTGNTLNVLRRFLQNLKLSLNKCVKKIFK
ncbi:pseudouridine synthase [Staphylococcus pseudintermedius]